MKQLDFFAELDRPQPRLAEVKIFPVHHMRGLINAIVGLIEYEKNSAKVTHRELAFWRRGLGDIGVEPAAIERSVARLRSEIVCELLRRTRPIPRRAGGAE